MCEFSEYFAFNKATNGQTDIKHEKENRHLPVFFVLHNHNNIYYIDRRIHSPFHQVCVCVQTNIDLGEEERKDEEKGSREEERKDYNMGVLRQVQVIFGHLASSKLQYFVPRGFWKHFKSVLLPLSWVLLI